MSVTEPLRIDTSKGTTGRYTATLEKPNGDPIAPGDLASLTLTLKDVYSDSVINTRNLQDVLNLNNVTLDNDGLLTWNVRRADNPVVNATRKGLELHIATFDATPASDAFDGLGWDVHIYVKRLGRAV